MKLYLLSGSWREDRLGEVNISSLAGLFGAESEAEALGMYAKHGQEKFPGRAMIKPCVTDMTQEVSEWVAKWL